MSRTAKINKCCCKTGCFQCSVGLGPDRFLTIITPPGWWYGGYLGLPGFGNYFSCSGDGCAGPNNLTIPFVESYGGTFHGDSGHLNGSSDTLPDGKLVRCSWQAGLYDACRYESGIFGFDSYWVLINADFTALWLYLDRIAVSFPYYLRVWYKYAIPPTGIDCTTKPITLPFYSIDTSHEGFDGDCILDMSKSVQITW